MIAFAFAIISAVAAKSGAPINFGYLDGSVCKQTSAEQCSEGQNLCSIDIVEDDVNAAVPIYEFNASCSPRLEMP